MSKKKNRFKLEEQPYSDDFNANLAKSLREINTDYLHLYHATRKKGTSFLRINNIQNAADSLFRAEEHIMQLESNIFHWKWVIICLQNSLYTFSLTVAAGTSRERVTKENGHIISFFESIKRCIGLSHYTYSFPLELTEDQKNSILWLHDHFRNSFEHFPPRYYWSVNLYGMPNICVDVLEAIKFLAVDGKNIRYNTNSKKKKIESSIKKSITLLKKSKFHVEKNEIKRHSKLKSIFK